jgi:hypothetical protein
VMDLATEDRLKHTRHRQRNGRRRHESRGPSAWRERPHPWPRAWPAERSFWVVANATGLLLAAAPAVAPAAGGTQRRPRTTGCNVSDDLHLPRRARRARVASVDGREASSQSRRGGTPRAEVCSPLCSPSWSAD